MNFLAQSGVLMYMEMAINHVAGDKSSFPWMALNDVKSELRLACVEAAEKFDPNRIGTFPYQFFLKCAKNRFYNIGRGVVFSNNPPCLRCDLWDKKNKLCKINEEGCEEILNHRNGMKRKFNLKSPLPNSNSSDDSFAHKDDVKDHRDTDLAMFSEEIKECRNIIPDNLKEDFDKLINREKVSKKKVDRIKAIILDYFDV